MPLTSFTRALVRTDASNRTVAVIGKIQPTVTRGRPSPPPPANGFDTAYTPFDRGHIFGLDIGGPDVGANVVPLYRYWQQSGTWRNMETGVKGRTNVANDLFVARLRYTDHPDTDAAQRLRLAQNEIFDWKDLRVPDTIDVWVIDRSSVLGTAMLADLFGVAPAAEADFLLHMAAVDGQTIDYPLVQTTMPPEDVLYWRNNQVGLAATAAYQLHIDQRATDIQTFQQAVLLNPIPGYNQTQTQEAIDVTRSPRRDDDVYFRTMHDEIRNELINAYNWTAPEAAALDGGRIVEATLGHEKMRERKAREKRADVYRAARLKARNTWKKHRLAGAPYTRTFNK